MKPNILDLELLLRVPTVDWEFGFDVSPSGEEVAFSWNLSGRWEIYLMPLDGSASPKQISAGNGSKFSPRWSPDGTRLAYALDEDGGERYDIYTFDFNSGEHINLTPDTPESIQPEISWSPDGKWLALASDVSGKFEAYVMPSHGGAIRRLLNQPYPVWKVLWSPDGAWIAVVTIAKGQDFYTYIAPVEGGEAMVISESHEPICAKDISWSSEGDKVAFSSDVHGYFDIGLFTLKNCQVSWLTRGKGDKEMPAWSSDGKQMVYLTGNGPKNTLTILNLNSSMALSTRVDHGVHFKPHFIPNREKVVFVFNNPSMPDDLWVFSIAEGTFQQLTHSLPPALQAASFVMPKEVSYQSLDGHQVPALLYRPPSIKDRPPAVLYVHGGPNWITLVTWDALVQHMVSRGWVVLAPNYRGSIGYGREWQEANRFDLGGGETMDVAAGVDYLVTQGIADEKRIAVTGRSHGGYLTMTCLTQYPQRWVAGSAVVPFLNWFTSHANSREDLQHWDLENFGDPEKDYQRYYDHSPFFFLDRISAQVQLICGAHDPRCPVSESLQAQDALVSMGKPCDFALYPDEGHTFLKIQNVIDAKKRQVHFLKKALE